jgi:hypothetical protein
MPFIQFRIHIHPFKNKAANLFFFSLLLLLRHSTSCESPSKKPPHHVFPKLFFLGVFPCPANKIQNITWLIVYHIQVTFLGSESNGLFKMQFFTLGIEKPITQVSYIPKLQEGSNTTEN